MIAAKLLVSVLFLGVNTTFNQSTSLLFCVHDVSWPLTEAREDQPVDNNLTPLDIKPSVNEFTDASDNESYEEKSKDKKAAKVWTVSIACQKVD